MPMMSAMTRKGRVFIIGSGIFLLAILSLFEAFTVAVLPVSEPAVGAVVLGLSVSEWLMFALGLVTPLMLAFFLVPLEYFLHTVRPVTGSVLQLLLQTAAFCLRAVGGLAVELGRLIVQCYDVIIFVPLRLESSWQKRLLAGPASDQANEVGVNIGADSENVTSLSFGSVNKRQ
jgi:hypothetical protein